MAVVVGLSPTAEGRSAVAVGVREAQSRETRLLLVCAEPADAGALAEARAQAADAGVVLDVIGPPSDTDLASAIVELAAERAAELVVIGLRRRSPVGKLILGAGAQRVLLDAPCPVLAVKPGAPV